MANEIARLEVLVEDLTELELSLRDCARIYQRIGDKMSAGIMSGEANDVKHQREDAEAQLWKMQDAEMELEHGFWHLV